MSQAAVRDRWAMSVEAKALFLVTGVLLAVGLSVLYSASAPVSGGAGIVQKQLVGALMGMILLAVASKFDAERWAFFAWPMIALSMFMLALVIMPGMPEAIAPGKLGAHRSLGIPGLYMQPSEFAKLAVIVWTSMLIVKKGDLLRHLFKGLTPFLLVVGALALLAGLEPDVSVALTLMLIMGVILFTSGARVGHFLFLGVLGLPALILVLGRMPYVMDRLEAVLHPGSGPGGHASQLSQSVIAVGSGGLFGQGYGEGMQQAGWVPLGYNDFIGSVLGEEFGFAGMLFVIAAFALYGYLGFRIAQNARTQFQQLVATGITFTMLFTAFVHLGVVIGMLPTTGLTLPFFSSGLSNLLLSFLMTGILVNIGSSRERVYGNNPESAERVQVASTA